MSPYEDWHRQAWAGALVLVMIVLLWIIRRRAPGKVNRAFRRLQAHHRHHHILGRMAAVNFNVTFPLMDRLFGTLEK